MSPRTFVPPPRRFRRAVGLTALACLLACEQQKVPPLRGVPPAQAADEQMAAAFVPGTVSLFAASLRIMPKATRQITLADGTVVVATYDREAPSEGDTELREGTPLVFAARPDGTVLPLSCPASLIERSRQTKTTPLLVPFGDGAALVYRSGFPNDRPTLYIADLAARAVIDTGRTGDLLGRGADADRFVVRTNDDGQARVVRWDGSALVELAVTAVPTSASYLDEPAPGVIAWTAPLSYRRSDSSEEIPLPSSLYAGQPFDGASLVRREANGSLLFVTASGVSRWAVEGDRSLVQIAPLAPFAAGLSAYADSDFGRTAAVRLVNNPYQASLSTPRGAVLRTFANDAFSVREIVATPCVSAAACDRVGETFLRDVLGEGANARAVQLFSPWLEGGLSRLVVTPASFTEQAAGGASGQGGTGAGGDGPTAGAAGDGGVGGGDGGSDNPPEVVCPVACPGACDAHALCVPVVVDPGPVLALSSSEVGNLGVVRPNAVGLVSSQSPDTIGTLFEGFAAATPATVTLSNADLYLATSTGVLWCDAFGNKSVPLTPAGARVVGVTPDHVYTAAPFGTAFAVQRNKRPSGAGEIVACLPQTAGPTTALDVRDADGGVLVGRGSQVFRYDGVAGGACETVPDGTLVLGLPAGTIDNLVYDPATDRFHVSAGDTVTSADSFGTFTLALPAGRDIPTALAARKGSVFYVQAAGAPGLPAGMAALVENTDGAVKTIAIVPEKITALAATDKQVYWITEGGALQRVPR